MEDPEVRKEKKKKKKGFVALLEQKANLLNPSWVDPSHKHESQGFRVALKLID